MSTKEIKPAERINSVSEYYFSKKLQEVAQLNAEGKNIISLGIGSPDLPPSKETIDTLCETARMDGIHGYQSYTGLPELRKAFADWYKKWYRVDLNPANEVLPLIGSKEGIIYISLAFLNPGDSVLIPNPGYPTYSSNSKLVQANIQNYDLLESNNWEPDFDAIEKLDLSNTKLMWVNYPNMPTGANASIKLFEKLVAFGKKHNIVIVNDNPYSFILNDNPISILEVDGAKDICIELNSMSKAHNMPGWRMGMLASNAEFIQWILKVESNIESGIFKPIQMAAISALKSDAAWYENNNKAYRGRRKIAEDIMTTLGCTFDPKQSGMFLWGKIPDKYTSSEQLADKLLYEANVFLTPGFIFGSNGSRFIRISLCCKDDKLKEALQRIKNIQ